MIGGWNKIIFYEKIDPLTAPFIYMRVSPKTGHPFFCLLLPHITPSNY